MRSDGIVLASQAPGTLLARRAKQNFVQALDRTSAVYGRDGSGPNPTHYPTKQGGWEAVELFTPATSSLYSEP
jgi:hypothetical protein